MIHYAAYCSISRLLYLQRPLILSAFSIYLYVSYKRSHSRVAPQVAPQGSSSEWLLRVAPQGGSSRWLLRVALQGGSSVYRS